MSGVAVHALTTTATTASLLLESTGRLPSFDLFACTIRGALLVDLGLTGRIVQMHDRIEVGASSAGVQLLDDVLDELVVGGTIDHQIRSGSTTLGDVGRQLVADGRWSGRGPFRRRFRVTDPMLLQLTRQSAKSLQRAEPVVERLLAASGVALPPPKASWRTPVGAGEVEWLVESVVDCVRDLRREYERRADVLRLNAATGARPSSPSA
jgi:hypothetical protein